MPGFKLRVSPSGQDIEGVNPGDVLVWDGSNWVPGSVTPPSGPTIRVLESGTSVIPANGAGGLALGPYTLQPNEQAFILARRKGGNQSNLGYIDGPQDGGWLEQRMFVTDSAENDNEVQGLVNNKGNVDATVFWAVFAITVP